MGNAEATTQQSEGEIIHRKVELLYRLISSGFISAKRKAQGPAVVVALFSHFSQPFQQDNGKIKGIEQEVSR